VSSRSLLFDFQFQCRLDRRLLNGGSPYRIEEFILSRLADEALISKLSLRSIVIGNSSPAYLRPVSSGLGTAREARRLRSCTL
jgi:hypothetical protein